VSLFERDVSNGGWGGGHAGHIFPQQQLVPYCDYLQAG